MSKKLNATQISLYEKLVEIAANKKGAISECEDLGEIAQAGYYKAELRALEEAQVVLFGVNPDEFRRDCMAVVYARDEAYREFMEG
jgi:hypothetical protein